MIAFIDADPNRVYILGYSAGGDAVHEDDDWLAGIGLLDGVVDGVGGGDFAAGGVDAEDDGLDGWVVDGLGEGAFGAGDEGFAAADGVVADDAGEVDLDDEGGVVAAAGGWLGEDGVEGFGREDGSAGVEMPGEDDIGDEAGGEGQHENDPEASEKLFAHEGKLRVRLTGDKEGSGDVKARGDATPSLHSARAMP